MTTELPPSDNIMLVKFLIKVEGNEEEREYWVNTDIDISYQLELGLQHEFGPLVQNTLGTLEEEEVAVYKKEDTITRVTNIKVL